MNIIDKNRVQMVNKLSDFMKQKTQQKFATDTGTEIHKKLQFVIIDNGMEQGAPELITKIKSKPELIQIFGTGSKAEVPIAGKLGNKFISRRIDRMIINESEKSIKFIDYKTDINKEILHDKYINQLSEYKQLLSKIYPNYTVSGYILWISDWTLEQMI